MTNIILISAKAGHGKDTTANFLKEILEANGEKVFIYHFADFVKFTASHWYGWDSKKDEKGRTLLQYLGTDLFRKNHPDCWVNMTKDFILGLGDSVNTVIIPDWRFPNEEQSLHHPLFNIYKLRVVRKNFQSNLTAEQQNHPSEISLDKAEFDYYIENSGTLEDLNRQVQKFVKEFLNK